jgi:LPXTG-site transpeptidase (sortase) family protein
MTILERIRKRPVLLSAGVLAFVLGLSLVAVGIYQGTRGDSPEEVVAASPTPAPTASPKATPKATQTPATDGTPPLGDQPYNFVIEKLGVNAPVQTFGLDENQVPEVPVAAGAADIVAWYDFSAQPGTGSNAVFAGHVTWNGEAVFYNLRTVTPGDSIRLVGTDGTVLAYKVTEVFQVDPNDPESLKVMAGTEEDVITIITCDGAYSDNNDPVFGGEYSHRLVVRGSLQEVVRPAG